MKYTVEGFSQAELFRLKLDSDDAVFLRWFVDFTQTGKMDRFTGPDGEIYYWVRYSKVMEELPILGLNSPDAVGRRLKRLVSAGVLVHHHHTINGSYSTFRIGPAFERFITSTPSDSSVGPPRPNGRTPSDSSVGAKNSSIIDPSTKDKFPQDSQPLILATILMTEHRKNDEKFLVGKESSTLQRWAADIEKIIRLDGRTAEDIRRVILWCQAPGCFWVPNILSGAKLREKFPTLWIQASKAPAMTEDEIANRKVERALKIIEEREKQGART